MKKVFISHSRYDTDLVSNVVSAMRNIDVTPVAMEYLPRPSETIPDWSRIRAEVSSSDLVMLFKTDNAIRTDYTKSWIVYEVGLSAAFNKPLFVFERIGPPIGFPIPYLTDYMLLDPSKPSDILKVQRLTKHYRSGSTVEDSSKPPFSETGIGGYMGIMLLLLIVAAAAEGYSSGELPINLTCPKHGVTFRYYADRPDRHDLRCPVCLVDGHWANL